MPGATRTTMGTSNIDRNLEIRLVPGIWERNPAMPNRTTIQPIQLGTTAIGANRLLPPAPTRTSSRFRADQLVPQKPAG
jgi:hypothetical protein